MDFDWKSLLKTVAPGIATALGGPLAGMAVQAIGGALGIDQATQETIAARIQGATPADMLAIRQAEEKFQLDMKALDIDLQKTLVQADVTDRASAREREIAIKDMVPATLALVVTTGFFFILVWMLRFGLPKDGGSEALLLLLGSLGTAWISVVSYYFGSSAQQVKQAAVINKIATTP